MNAARRALEGLGILVTRPAHQAEALCRHIEQQGGRAERLPVMDILGPADPESLRRVAGELDQYDWAVFISANAVERALDKILAVRAWPATVGIAVIGRRSAQALTGYGLHADLFPRQGYDSEALLALPELQQLAGQRVVIFRGNGGREFLADTLRARGAQVDYVEAYQRVRPQTDVQPLLNRLQAGAIDVVVVNSGESLDNLCAMLPKEELALLKQLPLLVVSERMVPLAAQRGFVRAPLVAMNATDDAVLAALLDWRAEPGQQQ
jgi:uroporphyrinogen-III synthase